MIDQLFDLGLDWCKLLLTDGSEVGIRTEELVEHHVVHVDAFMLVLHYTIHQCNYWLEFTIDFIAVEVSWPINLNEQVQVLNVEITGPESRISLKLDILVTQLI